MNNIFLFHQNLTTKTFIHTHMDTDAVLTPPPVDRSRKEVQFPAGCDSLLERCVHIMHVIDPVEKADLTLLLGEQWRATIEARKETPSTTGSAIKKEPILALGRATPPDIPLRPDNLEFVRPGYGVKVGKAGSLSSRIAILHALANVEQWAIDTALDNMARFGYYTQATAGTREMTEEQIEHQPQETNAEENKEGQQEQQSEQQEFTMPNRFFDDFMQMACDESKVQNGQREQLPLRIDDKKGFFVPH